MYQSRGYHEPIRRDRGYNTSGGVAIYIRSHLPVIERTDLETDEAEAVLKKKI